ncbi:hypothetical protein P3U41_05615 [Mammaliicoccus sciuri]|uniref:hypothetical protein n=1 Tax=Mammaliicoccus sciuri TaxID=1296 RepID=UPI002B25987D|nr:hypothetical protein [Mammaliicoccus sciuri]WQL34246.1 hypothetical protein P3U41_05615 [Mammaliicoccus sciuri]WQL61185.1 hypothetical protein P3T96_05615 [Mammaliicoccus sciuri]
MTKITIYYIKDVNNNVVYTNTNEFEFTQHVNNHLGLGFVSRYISIKDIQEKVSELEIGKKEIEVKL